MTTIEATPAVHPVDEVPPLAALAPLGLQHVLAMYAGAVAVPLIVGGALVNAGRFDAADLAYLITADLFIAGIATIIQSVGFWRFGVRLPLMQGCTFAAVSPMIVIGTNHGVTAIYGAVIASGIFMIALAPLFAKLLRFFPPLVTGTVILLIGLSLLPVAAGWIVAGSSTAEEPGADPKNIALAAGVLVLILVIERWAPGALGRVSILLGIVLGTIVAVPLGMTSFGDAGDAAWFGISTPFYFGLPTFQVSSVIAMCIVALVIMTETTGDMIAVGEIVEKKVSPGRLADGLRADGLSTALGGVFNTFPYTAFAQNVGLVSLTGVRSRYVATMAGGILVVLGLLPKLGEFVAGIPQPVLGGAGVALFGMVAASGVRTLSTVTFTHKNVLVVAISIGIGMLPTLRDGIYERFPDWFTTIFDSGISAGAMAAILLNIMFGGAASDDDAHLAAHDAVREGATVDLTDDNALREEPPIR